MTPGEHAANGPTGRGDLPSSLEGVANVLWPHAPQVWVGGGEPPSGFRVVESFSVLPNARHRVDHVGYIVRRLRSAVGSVLGDTSDDSLATLRLSSMALRNPVPTALCIRRLMATRLAK